MSKLVPKFAPGEIVSQCVVLDAWNTNSGWRYRVECRKCGDVREVTQQSLNDVARKQHKTCRACRNRSYKENGLAHGEAGHIAMWKSTYEAIAACNALMSVWPAISTQTGHWVWTDQPHG